MKEKHQYPRRWLNRGDRDHYMEKATHDAKVIAYRMDGSPTGAEWRSGAYVKFVKLGYWEETFEHLAPPPPPKRYPRRWYRHASKYPDSAYMKDRYYEVRHAGGLAVDVYLEADGAKLHERMTSQNERDFEGNCEGSVWLEHTDHHPELIEPLTARFLDAVANAMLKKLEAACE